MNYKYKNINVNVSNLNPNYIQVTGETHMTLPSDLVADLLKYSCTFFEFFSKYEYEELFSELEEDLDNIVNHFKNLNEDLEIMNPDVIISTYEYALENPDREFTFDLITENISWVIHDILHAVHDTAGCTIYVDSDVEKSRIIKSLEITQEQFPNEMPGWKFLDNLENSFHNRFSEYLDLEQFKLLEEYV